MVEGCVLEFSTIVKLLQLRLKITMEKNWLLYLQSTEFMMTTFTGNLRDEEILL